MLTVFGDSLDNTVTLSRDAAGTILVNGDAGQQVNAAQTEERVVARLAKDLVVAGPGSENNSHGPSRECPQRHGIAAGTRRPGGMFNQETGG